jgi:glycosyltransferase involved in cell wall biosynthesis
VTPESSAGVPFVSVVIPVRNEHAFIARTLDRMLAQDYPADRMEIIVADGMSDDGTREIVRQYTDRHPQIRLIDNPERVTPSGLNRAIAAARGAVISRIDGHCEVSTDFIRQNVQLLEEHPEAWAVGGPMVHAGAGLLGEAIAIAMSHPLGVGMANHRFAHFEGYVDTVQFPAFRRWVFDRIEAFDVRLVRTEDDELNYRIVQAGGKLFVSPRVKYVYYVRDRIGRLFQQYFQYSFWRIPVMRKHRKPTTVRQVIPLLFFALVIGAGAAGLWFGIPWMALALPTAYIGAMLTLSASLVVPKGLTVALLVPVSIATMHVAYAAGLAYGIFAAVFGARAWELNGRMSALSR